MNVDLKVRGSSRLTHHRVPVLALLPLVLLPVFGCSRVESEPTPPSAERQFRDATWNIRFFPEPSTDVERTGQLLAEMDADLIAVQEIADSIALRRLLEQVNSDLAQKAPDSGAEPARRYRFVLAESGGHGGQFVGYIYDENAAELWDVETLTSLQMTPDLRPGLFARVTSKRGRLDFQVIVMHTDSGTKDRDYQNRRRFLDALEIELAKRYPADSDVIVLGDLNTMGRLAGDGLPRVRWEEEVSDLDERAREMGMTRLRNSPACTEYYRGRGSFLDHILVSETMTEAPAGAFARVLGYCAAVDCQPVDQENMPYDYAYVSDHCPVVIDLVDADED
jgi:endonuclease/exonuclease/phosphatase family metal-dependent hydrolase